MPSAVVTIPENVVAQLEELDSDYSCGDLTKKGYCKKKWKILQPHVESKLVLQVEKLQAELEATDLSEDDYYSKMIELLKEDKSSQIKDAPVEPEVLKEYKPSQNKDSPMETEVLLKEDDSPENKDVPMDSDGSIDEREISNGAEAKQTDLNSSEMGPSSPATPKSNKKSLSSSKAKKKVENSSTGENHKSSRVQEVKEEESPESSKNDVLNGSAEKRKVKEEKVESDEEIIGDSNTGKKIKLIPKSIEKEEEELESEKSVAKKEVKPAPKKCEYCRQLLNDSDLILYQGHPHNAVEEFVALTDPKLSLFTGEEAEIHSHDERPQNKVTHFTIYDKAGHLCPIDSGLVERNVLLYFSGYVKAVYEEDPSIEGGIPAMDIGPINEWWVSGFDGGEKALIGFSTPYGEYYLMDPSPDYEPFMTRVREKIYMGKIVIEFLLDEENPSYEDLLNKLQTSVPPPGLPKLTEDSLLRHAQFVCDQVLSFDSACENTDSSLVTTPCIRALIHLAGVTFGKRQAMRRNEKKEFKIKKPIWTKATTTPLVSTIFETFFTGQLDNEANENDKGPRRRRCGVCEACQLADCGTCVSCVDMVKFGGSGRSKQCCIKRRCPNMAVQEADDSEPEDEDSYQLAAEEIAKAEAKPLKTRVGSGKKQVDWIGEKILDDGRRIFYKSAKVGDDIVVNIGDYVSVEAVSSTSPVVVGRVAYMWQNQFSQKFMHANWFCRSSETVLGETGDPQELFLVDDCENSLLNGITGKVDVVYKPSTKEWKLDGEVSENSDKFTVLDDGKSFFYQKRYDETYGRFEDPLPDPVCQNKAVEHRFCFSCERLYQLQKFETPCLSEKIENEEKSKEIHYGVVTWKGEEFRQGCCVFLKPGTLKFKTNSNAPVSKASNRKTDKVDEELYPEFYRKSSDRVKGSNETTPQPFCIGLVTGILTTVKDKLVAASDIYLKVTKFYRPENTTGITNQPYQLDLNLLYASDEETTVSFSDVTGKCVVIYSENLVDDLTTWCQAGPNRFYFSEGYDSVKTVTTEPTKLMKQLGNVGKGKGKGKGSAKLEKKKIEAECWPSLSKPLNCLDVFAGCGGLSEGLHQAGVADTKWAIEKEEPAVNAFRLNNPNSIVFNEDCNYILKLVMNGKEKSDNGQRLPQKGEVELLCGGPPCQGFSGMNRFNSRQYSLFKNSLIVSYLSYCDYYRPRFFILENVRNFVSFKRSMVLKLTLRCLLKMGYQVAFGVLQAGNYGVPQTRRRAIVLAAAPGEKLPNFPEPTHVFNPRATQLTVMVDDKKFVSNCQWVDSAPLRTITVRDSMSDLPEIRNGANQDVMPYTGEPMSHFQKMMRGDQYQAMLKDHICKEMAAIVEARIAHVPTATGSDWRDLPNMVVRLNDGTYTKKLQYTHHDKKNGKSSTGALRGVCNCATGKACDPMDKQFNTIIPWCLPHTGNRHNHWAGLYGRLEWDGFFSTTVTNPEPMGKQGRVLHPEQTRVVSVRECARSQGFPDKYRFYGSILDKHRQVGNAVPPPLGAAIGREIRKCASLVEEKPTKSLEEKMITDD